jgi:hypothetical protein
VPYKSPKPRPLPVSSPTGRHASRAFSPVGVAAGSPRGLFPCPSPKALSPEPFSPAHRSSPRQPGQLAQIE